MKKKSLFEKQMNEYHGPKNIYGDEYDRPTYTELEKLPTLADLEKYISESGKASKLSEHETEENKALIERIDRKLAERKVERLSRKRKREGYSLQSRFSLREKLGSALSGRIGPEGKAVTNGEQNNKGAQAQGLTAKVDQGRRFAQMYDQAIAENKKFTKSRHAQVTAWHHLGAGPPKWNPKLMTYLRWQEEICNETKKDHYQIFVQWKGEKGPMGIIKDMGYQISNKEEGKICNAWVTNSPDHRVSDNYAGKEFTRKPNGASGTHGELDLGNHKKKTPQKKVMKLESAVVALA